MKLALHEFAGGFGREVALIGLTEPSLANETIGRLAS